MTDFVPVVGILTGLWFPAAFVLAVHRHGRKGGVTDRRSVVDSLLTALVGVALAFLFVPWGPVPPLLWAVPVALTVYALALAVPLWRELPWVAGPRRALKLAVTAAGSALVVLVVALAV